MNRDDINKLILEHGLFHGTVALGVVMDAGHLQSFAALVAAAEREACAKVCDALSVDRGMFHPEDEAFKSGVLLMAEVCAMTIRARANKA